MPAPDPLLTLSHQLGREDRDLAILGEGNASSRLNGAPTFWVKASGANLGILRVDQLVECRLDALLPLLESSQLTDAEVDARLLEARVNLKAPKPSVEAVFHAYLLTLPGVAFVGHTHPIAVNQLLCSSHATAFARGRLFPDEIVCCGAESVLVPYTDPGLKLAVAIRRRTAAFIRRTARPPRLVLLANHGLIALGATAEGVLAATLMAVKAARIYAGAAAMGGSPRSLTPPQVTRIAGRPDEHYRQRALGL